MKVTRLASDLFAVAIHGITGQEYEEGTLAAGTLVRDVAEVPGSMPDPSWTFLASTDGGKTWYLNKTFELPVLETTWSESA